MITDSVYLDSFNGFADMSSSDSGVIAYSEAGDERRLLTWRTRSGTALSTVPFAASSQLRLSPDARFVASVRNDAGWVTSLWLTDLSSGTDMRLYPGNGAYPFWRGDGKHVVFSSWGEILQVPADGSGTATLLHKSDRNQNLSELSGSTLLYTQRSAGTGLDIWALVLEKGETPTVVAQSIYDEDGGRLSPDGRWIAYTSNETGRNEVYIQIYPQSQGKRRISIDGGSVPMWSGNGRELIYRSRDFKLMSVRLTPSGNTIAPDPPQPLFPVWGDWGVGTTGDRLLTLDPLPNVRARSIVVLKDWQPETVQ